MPHRLVAWTLFVALAGCSRSEPTKPTAKAYDGACRSGDVARALESHPSAPVILILKDGGDIGARQDRVLLDLGPEFQLERRYEAVPGMSGQLSATGYERAQKHVEVQCVQFDGPGGGA